MRVVVAEKRVCNANRRLSGKLRALESLPDYWGDAWSSRPNPSALSRCESEQTGMGEDRRAAPSEASCDTV